MFSVDPTLPPPNLRTLLPRSETPWMISPSLFNRLQDVPGSNYRKCEILNQDPEWEFILQYFCAQKPANKSIARAYCIHNRAQHSNFESNISIIEQQAQNPHFVPKWRTEAPNPLREKVISRWNALTDPYTTCTLPNARKDQIMSTKIIPLWHGTKEVICQSICSTGFTIFGKHALIQGGQDTQNTDTGYFGSGIYFTTSANYAATIYSDGNLLLAWVSMREPYPVIADKSYPQPTDMKTLGTGLGAYQNHNAHYIPVISTQPNNPKCAIYYPCTEAQSPTLDEIVVFSSSQTLARFWIELGPDLLTDPLKLPTMTTFNHLLEYILQLLDTEAVQHNPQLHQILEKKSKVLLTCNPNDSLTAEDLKFYNCTLKLLDQTGKVRSVVLKQLRHQIEPKLLETSFSNQSMESLFGLSDQEALQQLKNFYQIDPSFPLKCISNGRTFLLEAIYQERVAFLKFFFSKDSNLICIADEDGKTLLYEAAYSGSEEVVSFLLSKKPGLISQYKENQMTPLHYAAMGGHVTILELLLKEDPTLLQKFRKHDGWTALHAAALHGQTEAARYLLEKDKNLLQQFTNDGWTPLHAAALEGHIEMGKLLYEGDPNLLNRINEYNKTALMLAESGNQTAFVQWLSSIGGIRQEDEGHCSMM